MKQYEITLLDPKTKKPMADRDGQECDCVFLAEPDALKAVLGGYPAEDILDGAVACQVAPIVKSALVKLTSFKLGQARLDIPAPERTEMSAALLRLSVWMDRFPLALVDCVECELPRDVDLDALLEAL